MTEQAGHSTQFDPAPLSSQRHPGVLETTVESFDWKAIHALSREDVLVIRVKQFVSEELCEILSTKAEDEIGYKSYLNVPSVRRIGMAFYETEGKADIIKLYFETAHESILAFRDACAPYCSPIDTLRCTLDEIWPAGANLQTLTGRKMFVGLSRMVRPGTTFLAHHDLFQEDAPGEPEANDLKAQFGANVYIKVPPEGGELLMWQQEISTPVFDRMRNGEYGLDISVLGPADLSVKPDRGDLLIFNSRKMHAVASGKDINRLALACFVAYRGIHKPLTFWS
jgi:2OG-Fe(II) oxygenase superfamily